MFTYTIPCFDLKQIALSGQCFRMNLLSSSASEPSTSIAYSIISQNYYLEVSQSGNQVTFDCPESDLAFWFHYFDLETDYATILDSIDPNDVYLTQAAHTGNGIRILNQDVWEMILTFIISQQNTIPKITRTVEALSEKYGTRLTATNGTSFYSFPRPEQLTHATIAELMELKLGYRAKYIERTAKDARTGLLNLYALHVMDYEDAKRYLMQFYGIGEKVANCVCLFGLHQIDAVPIDTWIQKILLREYYRPSYDSLPKNQLFKQILQDSFEQYKGYRGIVQQYMFFYERIIASKKDIQNPSEPL